VCTMIGARTRIQGSAKTATGWAKVDEANVSFDHATHAWSDHALRLDFVNSAAPTSGRAAVELDLRSAKALLADLGDVIRAAERSGITD
jgi:hypothetical protein